MKAVKDVSEEREPSHTLRDLSSAHAPRILVSSDVVRGNANGREYVKSLETRIQAK